MMKYTTSLLIFMLTVSVLGQTRGNSDIIDLAGKWQFQIDRSDKGNENGWGKLQHLEDEIDLPGSMLTRGKGDNVTIDTKWVSSLYDSSFFYSPVMEKYRQPDNYKATFFLTPDHHYVGTAWYNRTIDVPQDFVAEHYRYILSLERPHIETTLFVNGQQIGKQNSLCVPHEYDVTASLKAGQNLIAIRIDNRLEVAPVGQDSHSVTDQTQGDWNGIVGKMTLRRVSSTRILQTDIYPDIAQHEIKIRYIVAGKSNEDIRFEIKADAFNTQRPHSVAPQTYDAHLSTGFDTIMVKLPMTEEVQLWDEFSPTLYRLETKLSSISLNKKKVVTSQTSLTNSTAVFGMREFTIEGTMFYCNGREVQLRGTVENCDFPLTGYAPMDLESWLRVFRICREWGLNHMRFHSYCPPAAAFEAADLVGFYLQPEGPSWPNHGVKLGQKQVIDTLLMDEVKALVREYGNHPSFCMLACGNEPAGNWVPWVGQFVDYWKAADPRRVYTGASVGGGWAWQPKSQYHVKAGARGLAEWTKRAPEAMSDFSLKISHYKAKDGEWDINEPYVSHETGQWCAFPDFDEIPLYTGPNKAKNFEVFRDILAQNGMLSRAHKFMMASGKLQALCYKYEIEKTLRTKGYAGFELLSLNDYSGQGTALVGVQNVFFEPKGYIQSREWREFCSPVVPLARIEKFTYCSDENFSAELLVNDHSAQATDSHLLRWTITDAGNNLFGSGNSDKIDLPLSKVKQAQKMTLRVNVYSQSHDADQPIGTNHWDFWVYPKLTDIKSGKVLVTDTLDSKALTTLMHGGNVLICAAGKVRFGNDIVQQFLPVFWNTSWFKMRPPHTTGLLIEDEHPAFKSFPTDYYSDLQWWELVNNAQVMQFSEFPFDFQPLVQSIDTWFLSRKIGMLFEARVGRGRLMMTTMDLQSDLEHRHVAKQMLSSLIEYMNSGLFNPRYTITADVIAHLFTREAPPVEMFTKGSPDELKPKLK